MEYKKNELSEFKGFIKNNHVNILHINRVHKGAYLSYYEVLSFTSFSISLESAKLSTFTHKIPFMNASL